MAPTLALPVRVTVQVVEVAKLASWHFDPVDQPPKEGLPAGRFSVITTVDPTA